MIRAALAGHPLSRVQAEAALEAMATGHMSTVKAAALLAALKVRGETVEELAGFASAMRRLAVRPPYTGPVIDTCGTGGDGLGTFNISTAAAFVVAACGLPVAKHGNRSVSSQSGSADVLEALGVAIGLKPEAAIRCLEEVGMTFLFAPVYHPAMAHLAPLRKELGVPTIFNLLGPLTNPLDPKQVVGVHSASLVSLYAEALRLLGSPGAWVVHGEGLDELSVCGPSHVTTVSATGCGTFTVRPEDFDWPRAERDELKGGDPATNARILEAILKGKEKGAKRRAVVLNAAAALTVGGKTVDLAAGVHLAEQAVAQGDAWNKVEALAKLSQSLA